MKKQQRDSGKFQTHIAEPRWQVVGSIVVVVALVVAEALFLLVVNKY